VQPSPQNAQQAAIEIDDGPGRNTAWLNQKGRSTAGASTPHNGRSLPISAKAVSMKAAARTLVNASPLAIRYASVARLCRNRGIFSSSGTVHTEAKRSAGRRVDGQRSDSGKGFLRQIENYRHACMVAGQLL